MPFDGSVVNNIVQELNEKIINGKVDKIYQPEKDEIIIHIRTFKDSFKLLLSSSANYPRLHITEESKSNPQTPPSFCMLLRKHLSGSKIISVKQPEYERIIEITFDCLDELGYSNQKTLIAEIMGRHSNIIFIDKETNKIIDAVKRVSFEISSVREILPGRIYTYPPSGGKQDTNKINPLNVSIDWFLDNIKKTSGSMKCEKYFINVFNGISPAIAKEICYNCSIDYDEDIKKLDDNKIIALFDSFNKIISIVKDNRFTPNIMFKEGQPIDFSCFDLATYKYFNKKYLDSISKVIEVFYSEKDNKDRIKQKSGDIHRIITNRLERCYKKLEKLNEDLNEAHNSEIYKIYGDLLTSNLHMLIKGQENAELLNYYSAESEYIKIPLDNQLTPAANAQKYYKLYNKSKNALKLVNEQIVENRQEIQYLESQLDNLDKCTEETEINEIRNELAEQGYINQKKDDKNKKNKPSKPLHFISSTGFDIYVGKNNLQNDYLTLKFAVFNDIWLHTKDIPGSHVIIKTNGKNIDDISLSEAATLAAYYSKAKTSSKVPVDYAFKKNVKKPNGAKPGMVIYENNKTIYIDPNEEVIKRINKKS